MLKIYIHLHEFAELLRVFLQSVKHTLSMLRSRSIEALPSSDSQRLEALEKAFFFEEYHRR